MLYTYLQFYIVHHLIIIISCKIKKFKQKKETKQNNGSVENETQK